MKLYLFKRKKIVGVGTVNHLTDSRAIALAQHQDTETGIEVFQRSSIITPAEIAERNKLQKQPVRVA